MPIIDIKYPMKLCVEGFPFVLQLLLVEESPISANFFVATALFFTVPVTVGDFSENLVKIARNVHEMRTVGKRRFVENWKTEGHRSWLR